MGETRVDLHHLLEDLRDAYAGSLEETILTEIVANSLDSGARTIRLQCDASAATLLAIDDGSGMQRRDLARYHDIASSTKARGQGIGFAGVGIKLGLLLCEYVLTETRRGTTHVATRWHLASRHKAPWKWEPPAGAVTERGTAVLLKLTNPLSPLLDSGFVESALRRHFQPLFEPALTAMLASHYPHGIRFEVNGGTIEADTHSTAATALWSARSTRRSAPISLPAAAPACKMYCNCRWPCHPIIRRISFRWRAIMRLRPRPAPRSGMRSHAPPKMRITKAWASQVARRAPIVWKDAWIP